MAWYCPTVPLVILLQLYTRQIYTLYKTSFDQQNIRGFGISLEYFTKDNIEANKWKTDEIEMDESKEKYCLNDLEIQILEHSQAYSDVGLQKYKDKWSCC